MRKKKEKKQTTEICTKLSEEIYNDYIPYIKNNLDRIKDICSKFNNEIISQEDWDFFAEMVSKFTSEKYKYKPLNQWKLINKVYMQERFMYMQNRINAYEINNTDEILYVIWLHIKYLILETKK